MTLVVQVPERMTEEQKDLLRKFDEAMNGGSTVNSQTSGSTQSEEPKKKKKFFDKVKEAEEQEKRGEITALECKKIGLIHGFRFDKVHMLWISYLNEGKWYWDGDYLVDFTMPDGYCPHNFWNNDGFDSYSVMGVYRDKDNYKTLFTILKERYIQV